MTINELITTAHSDAKANGWWDEPRNTGELLMLIVSECGEALEAHRSGKRWTNPPHIGGLDNFDAYASSYPEGWKLCFEHYIKDTFEDELADIVIRIADLMGGLHISVDESAKDPFSYGNEFYQQWHLQDNVGEFLFERVVRSLCGFASKKDNGIIIPGSLYHTPIASINAWCQHHNINLWRHIELKLAYNRTRPRKHGKAY